MCLHSPALCRLTTIVLCGIAALAPPAKAVAVPERNDEFQQRVRKLAAERSMYVEAWWSANLDADAAPEYVARLCSRAENTEGMFLIVDGEKEHRLKFSFAMNGRGPWCREAKTVWDRGLVRWVIPNDLDASMHGQVEPPFRRTSERFVEHWQGGHSSYEWIHVALRGGRSALISRVQKLRPHCSEEMTNVVRDFREDWDALFVEEIKYRYDGRQSGSLLSRHRMSLVPWTECGSRCDGIREDARLEDGEISFIGQTTIEAAGKQTERIVKVAGGRYPRPDEAKLARLTLETPGSNR